jgi:hypothetical protein
MFGPCLAANFLVFKDLFLLPAWAGFQSSLFGASGDLGNQNSLLLS